MNDLNNVLTALKFIHQGEFEPVHFDADGFDVCNIGCWIVAIKKDYIALLNYSEMEFWDIDDDSIKIAMQAISAISDYEIHRIVQRQVKAVITS